MAMSGGGEREASNSAKNVSFRIRTRRAARHHTAHEWEWSVPNTAGKVSVAVHPMEHLVFVTVARCPD